MSIDTITIVEICLSIGCCRAFGIIDNLILLLFLIVLISLLLLPVIIIVILMVFDFAIEIDKVFAGFRQPKLKVLPIEVFLYVLMALLEFSDNDFLSLIEVSSVGHATSLIWVFILRV